jgi:hypothetical protein
VRPGRGHRQVVDDRVHDVAPDAVILEHEPEDRHEHNRQRRDREQNPVRDPSRELRTLMREEPLHRVRDDAGELPRAVHPLGLTRLGTRYAR